MLVGLNWIVRKVFSFDKIFEIPFFLILFGKGWVSVTKAKEFGKNVHVLFSKKKL